MKIAWYVDDDAEMIEAVSLMMKLLDFDVKPFLSARDAAAELKEFRPHLLILDLNMPEISGMDLLEFVRRRPELEGLPILMLTSEDADAMLDLAMEKGANGYALKPVTLEELDAAIKRVMPEK
jgi:DNA-binding response OmpR family regulator